MPEDSKKNDKKSAKEQRKPRQRHQQAKVEKKPEKTEESRSVPKVTVPQKPPVYESPPPEFYKNLKRETDEILKITEEENTKYKKKEIQSNWSKYEVAIESYEEIDEQENLGADYEKLIEAPLSVGGHFQFKHEKSWDINTSPSQYDKYFDINMEDLNIAICTIPFYERNNIEASLFNETDKLTMTNRSTRFKQKYFNDKSYSTPETEVHDKILSSLRDNMKNEDNTTKNVETHDNNIEISYSNDVKIHQTEDKPKATDINLDIKSESINTIDSNKIIEDTNNENLIKNEDKDISDNKTSLVDDHEHDDFIFGNTIKPIKSQTEIVERSSANSEAKTVTQPEIKSPPMETKIAAPIMTKVTTDHPTPAVDTPEESKKNPVIESPEDLEKWLDDFLDG